MIRIRLKGPVSNLPRIPLLTAPFVDALEMQSAYEHLFFGTPAGARVLADILQSNGACSPAFTGGFDPVRAAHNDGAKTAALQILRMAGGDLSRLDRALALNNLMEARDE